ncbi:hypothetical protein [Methanoregula formicica]|uniref:hypothetical protein n=1 Tax=Methanoregula formicica TaxID=882104 RepID=UPI00064E5BD4|nr:hypothetical protein [Methanoregula formicica]
MTAVDIRGARRELQSGTADIRKKGGGTGHDQNTLPAHTRKTKSGEIKFLYCFISKNFIHQSLFSCQSLQLIKGQENLETIIVCHFHISSMRKNQPLNSKSIMVKKIFRMKMQYITIPTRRIPMDRALL